MSISSIVNLTAGKIGELLAEEAKLLYGVKDQVQSLQKDLIMMKSFLRDMEAMDEEVGDERSRTTIKEIRKIAYDAEDAIESYILEEVGKIGSSSSTGKKEDLFKRYLCFCSPLLHTHQIGSEIEAIKARIVETMERWEKFVGEKGLRIDLRQGLNNNTRVRIRPIAYSHTYEDHVVGLDEDINKLVGVLTTHEGTKIRVVSIEGMGGSSKTTLARKLFNHETVKKHFDCFAWVSVSQQWVAQQILLDLLNKVGGEAMRMDESHNSPQVLVEKLHRYLEGKGYLIVLDDVWEEKALEEILPALPLESDGRKIIITTRNKKVVDYPNLKPLTYPHEPRRLEEDESWELFRKIALIHNEETNNCMDIAKLEALGKEMLKKCKGLPLAVIALAGILSEKETLEEWDKISKAVSSRIMEDGKGTHLYGPVNQMLTLSYSDLPPELKPCFLYLARYPEDYEILVGMLIRLWIAEGFFTTAKRHEGDTVEGVARRYLDGLVHRCLVQVASRGYEGKVKTIQIHDLVRDLCIRKAKVEDFLETFTYEYPNSDTIVTESRRAFIFSPYGMFIPFPTKSQHLRSVEYVVDDNKEEKQRMSLQLIHENFRLLRVLLLVGVKTSDGSLPAGIGSLIHLRYLCLRNTNIRELPSSIGNLRNLLTLDLHNLLIPDVLWKIEGLRNLYLHDCDPIYLETLKLDTLKYLQTLKGVRGGSWMLKEVPRLSPTVQKLSIKYIRSQEQLEAAFQFPSIREDSLHSLSLSWYIEQVVKLENLEPIIHSQHLRKLWLWGRIVDKFGIQFPTSINKLALWETELEAEATLVALGKLPQLTILQLVYRAYVGTKWTCTAGEFPQLKELLLHQLTNLEEWSIEMGAMPQLSKLQVLKCEKLRKLPEGLKFITTLQKLQLSDMSEEFKQRIKGGGEDAHIIQHVSLVKCN